jgi:alcohol dehydrogenase class IV
VNRRGFTWHDGERTIRFGRGVAQEAVGVLGGPGYALLTTPRALAAAPDEIAEMAGAVHEVGPGLVDELAGDLLDEVQGDRIVALGGGRVVDVAKALASASGGTRAMAIPTTLSGAEMTRGHRRARGAPAGAPGVRPAVVVNDPGLSASQPVSELAASALNALGHAVEGPCTPRANPVATLAALEAARLLVGSFRRPAEPDRDALALGALLAGYTIDSTFRDALALGALLAGYTIDSTFYGLHHVLSQTLVRVAGASHGQANAIMLPHTIGALGWRFPDWIERLGEAVGSDPAEAATRLCELTGATSLRELGIDIGDAALDACADAAAQRTELELTPPRADRAELRSLYAAAH